MRRALADAPTDPTQSMNVRTAGAVDGNEQQAQFMGCSASLFEAGGRWHQWASAPPRLPPALCTYSSTRCRLVPEIAQDASRCLSWICRGGGGLQRPNSPPSTHFSPLKKVVVAFTTTFLGTVARSPSRPRPPPPRQHGRPDQGRHRAGHPAARKLLRRRGGGRLARWPRPRQPSAQLLVAAPVACHHRQQWPRLGPRLLHGLHLHDRRQQVRRLGSRVEPHLLLSGRPGLSAHFSPSPSPPRC